MFRIILLVINKISMLYRETFWSFEKQAIMAGVKMGKDNYIASHFWDTEPYLISIGNNCAITSGVLLFTHGGARVARFKYPKFDVFGKVIIGNSVYIGKNSLIMPGVKIGDNVLVASGSVVTKSIPSNVVIAGNPAKVVCTIEQYIEKNKKYNTNSKGMSIKEKKELLLSLPENMFIKKNYIKY